MENHTMYNIDDILNQINKRDKGLSISAKRNILAKNLEKMSSSFPEAYSCASDIQQHINTYCPFPNAFSELESDCEEMIYVDAPPKSGKRVIKQILGIQSQLKSDSYLPILVTAYNAKSAHSQIEEFKSVGIHAIIGGTSHVRNFDEEFVKIFQEKSNNSSTDVIRPIIMMDELDFGASKNQSLQQIKNSILQQIKNSIKKIDANPFSDQKILPPVFVMFSATPNELVLSNSKIIRIPFNTPESYTSLEKYYDEGKIIDCCLSECIENNFFPEVISPEKPIGLLRSKGDCSKIDDYFYDNVHASLFDMTSKNNDKAENTTGFSMYDQLMLYPEVKDRVFSYQETERDKSFFYYNNIVDLKKLQQIKEDYPDVYNSLCIDKNYGSLKPFIVIRVHSMLNRSTEITPIFPFLSFYHNYPSVGGQTNLTTYYQELGRVLGYGHSDDLPYIMAFKPAVECLIQLEEKGYEKFLGEDAGEIYKQKQINNLDILKNQIIERNNLLPKDEQITINPGNRINKGSKRKSQQMVVRFEILEENDSHFAGHDFSKRNGNSRAHIPSYTRCRPRNMIKNKYDTKAELNSQFDYMKGATNNNRFKPERWNRYPTQAVAFKYLCEARELNFHPEVYENWYNKMKKDNLFGKVRVAYLKTVDMSAVSTVSTSEESMYQLT